MLKDKLYWPVYNQKRREYLTLKKREWRKRAKRVQSTTSQENLKVVDNKPTEVLDPVVDTLSVVDQEVVDQLTKLIQSWQTNTNYSCPPTCLYSYCSNCWFFINEQLVDYKGELM